MRILNLQMNRQVPCLLAVLHLEEAGVVHLLDVVIERLLPLGEHLVVVIPGELLHASKVVQLLHTLPTLGWQLLVAGGRLLAGSLLASDSWLTDSWLTRLHVALVGLLSSPFREA